MTSKLRYSLIVLVVALGGCNRQDLGLALGTQAPRLATKTLADVGGDLSRMTTYRQPDPRMYQYSLDQALATGKPILLEFATPGHCSVCDRQLQITKAMLDKYQPNVLFLHMDQYENPEAFKTYRVMGDPWTFVIDTHGIVRYQQAGPMLYQEMDAAIRAVLPAPHQASLP
ncbi:thioredoxin family protein [Ferrovum sp.]|jgi:thiol-disulfide isomerase/thioredoxin|uniref:TlpA family protein disulfide reductase n=1 Tax=Ferrovum sp. TaxID=2609467 RepID=UPI0026302E53|nr:thioredoxin family protein [Ferrovum sp.]